MQGKCVTFMAKWDYGLAGSSCHVHTSLVDAETARRCSPTATATASCSSSSSPASWRSPATSPSSSRPTSTPTSASRPARSRRPRRSGAATTAPRASAWSAHGPSLRVECRIPGADANPYLACAALLAAGLHGIEQRLELEPAFSGDAYKAKDIREVPKTLREALECLDRSAVLRAAFGDAVIEHYLHAGRWEQFEYDRRVTDHELIRGFERA